MLVGMTIVALGTSAPEIVVSLMTSLDGIPDLAIGNALGSNIANIGLILGTTALVMLALTLALAMFTALAATRRTGPIARRPSAAELLGLPDLAG